MHFKRFAFGIMLTLLAVGAWASNFRAADTVYLPAVAKIVVDANNTFKTDVVISNLTADSVDVDFAISSGQNGTPNAVSSANLKRVATLKPFERREIIDFVQTVLGSSSAFGQGVFFACKTGGNCLDCQTNSGDCRLISVEGRIYTESTSGCTGGAAKCTTGQLFSGIPWYNFVSSTASDKSLDKVFIAGLRQTGVRGESGTYRSNIGVVNASNLGSTTVTVTLFRNDAPTTPVGTPYDVSLGPLGQFQGNVATMFPGFSGSGFVTVQEKSFTPTTPGDTNAIPGFLAYGSILDNVTQDPTTLEAQYFTELEWLCVYGSKPEKRPLKR